MEALTARERPAWRSLHIGLAVAVLAAGLLATAAGALEVDRQRDQREQARFMGAVGALSSDLEHEVDRYEDASTAAARYFSMAAPVSNDEFMAWGQGGLLDGYPGLR